MSIFEKFLSHPLTRGLDGDDPRTTRLRRRLVRGKPFLRKIYEEWYASLLGPLEGSPGRVLEIGSGPGFLKHYLPRVVTSDVFLLPGVDVLLDGRQLPFSTGSLEAVVMLNVFHHVSCPRSLLAETARCVEGDGRLVMIEPWCNRWARWVYQNHHHEPFRPEAASWSFPSTGPLSGANGALPWIVFDRDRDRFEKLFPEWTVESIEGSMPFRYLLSGGVTLRSLVPGWSFSLWRSIESLLLRSGLLQPMFARIVLRRTGGSIESESAAPTGSGRMGGEQGESRQDDFSKSML